MLIPELQKIKNNLNTYTKPHLSFEEQLKRLKSNGLIISNSSYARKKLTHINYYRLSSYFLTFQYPKNSTKVNQFYPQSEFRHITRLYDFDVKFRRLLFGAMETIEVYIRTQIAYHHSAKYEAFGYISHKNFQCSEAVFEELLEDVKKESERSDEKFIKHFKDKYGATDLPIWSIVEVLSFGTLSKIFYAMHNEDKKLVIEQIPVTTTVFSKWLHSLTILRNICAHHSRAWNRELRVPFAIPSNNSMFDPLRKITKSKFKAEVDGEFIYEDKEYDNNNSIFFGLSVIKYIFDSIGEEVDFVSEIKQLLKSYPEIDLKAMGYVDGWQNLDIWSDV
ncbi:Abi family protein [Candidatus Sulfurimonas baltica]|uniref:Abi family protein n=1 Tax=Candidatus Sulfurimonas baltica TaxID=2740404 RepID=A0A7S7LUG9_9BACT|nr:Abi family protein [Candidatus Sulfurimonas baltica]QOY51711.1 Abi family protein [Candidatus Sulfurimonas baltica]